VDELKKVDLSIVIPIKNESENLSLLMADLLAVLAQGRETYEIIFIDDGSTDCSCQVLEQLQLQSPVLRAIRFDRNYGKTAALSAGFEQARGDTIIIMDGDRQNDPLDIPHFLKALEEGHDIVCGYRIKRSDNWFRRLQSRIANRIRNLFTHDGVHDSGCGYQAMRRECLKKIRLYSGMHRFLPCLFQMEGFSMAQIPVRHHPRMAGVSKYPFWRRLRRAGIDLIAVRWMLSRRIAYRMIDRR
jgi:glycosyltransferase involved in cell wall biosynthesis